MGDPGRRGHGLPRPGRLDGPVPACSAGRRASATSLPKARGRDATRLAGLRGQAADIAIQAEQHAYTKRRMAELIALSAPASRSSWSSPTPSAASWFTAEQAVEYGLCDKVNRFAARSAPPEVQSVEGGADTAVTAGAAGSWAARSSPPVRDPPCSARAGSRAPSRLTAPTRRPRARAFCCRFQAWPDRRCLAVW